MHNSTIMSNMIVEIAGRIPWCLHCTSNDCVHVGFALCASLMAKSGALTAQ